MRPTPAHRPLYRLAPCGQFPGEEWRRAWARRRGTGAEATGETLDPCTRSAKLARLEAALLVADAPLSPRKLAQFAALADAREVRELIQQLNDLLEQTGSTFRVERVSSG